jgi:hypothetical protein
MPKSDFRQKNKHTHTYTLSQFDWYTRWIQYTSKKDIWVFSELICLYDAWTCLCKRVWVSVDFHSNSLLKFIHLPTEENQINTHKSEEHHIQTLCGKRGFYDETHKHTNTRVVWSNFKSFFVKNQQTYGLFIYTNIKHNRKIRKRPQAYQKPQFWNSTTPP